MPDAAAVIITDAANRVLLIREGYGRERYGLPGGVIEEIDVRSPSRHRGPATTRPQPP